MSLVKQARKQAASKSESTASMASDAASAVAYTATEAAGVVKEAAVSAWDKVAPVAEEAYAKVSDTVVPALGSAVEKGRRRGRRAAVKLNLAEEPKKSHKLRKLLIVVGVAGAAAFVYKKFGGGSKPDHFGVRAGDSGPDTDSAARPNETAPTAPLAAEETKTSPVATDPDNPTETTPVP
jgi:hypothetical protein